MLDGDNQEMMKLYLRTRSDGTLVYGIGSWYRIFYMIFLILLSIGAFVYRKEPGFTLFSGPFFVASILFIAAVYQEVWIFDKKKRTVVYEFGLVFAHRRKVFLFDEIEAFELTHFKKGTRSMKTGVKRGANRLYVTFSLVMHHEEKHDIEIIRLKKSAGRTEHAAVVIARYCGVELICDAEPDEETRDE